MHYLFYSSLENSKKDIYYFIFCIFKNNISVYIDTERYSKRLLSLLIINWRQVSSINRTD